MKKILLILTIIMLLYIYNNNSREYYVIPEDAIRFRIVANSNSIYDQYIKDKVKENLEKKFFKDLNLSNNIEESRKTIISNINNYEDIVKTTLNSENYDKEFTINYGLNYFPAKEYKDVIYEEGNYESLVVTIGDGSGNNFWCVLFPPICTLEVEDSKNIEYKFLIKDLFDKYFN